jgi:hypothetical protein
MPAGTERRSSAVPGKTDWVGYAEMKALVLAGIGALCRLAARVALRKIKHRMESDTVSGMRDRAHSV